MHTVCAELSIFICTYVVAVYRAHEKKIHLRYDIQTNPRCTMMEMLAYHHLGCVPRKEKPLSTMRCIDPRFPKSQSQSNIMHTLDGQTHCRHLVLPSSHPASRRQTQQFRIAVWCMCTFTYRIGGFDFFAQYRCDFRIGVNLDFMQRAL